MRPLIMTIVGTLNQVMSNFGLSFATPIELAFVVGFVKG